MAHPAASVGFDRSADAYERGRPGYPDEAIRWLTVELELGAGKTVVDLGAGTGKLTRALVPSGARLVAIEPVARMRGVLAKTVPAAEARAGTAEEIPLPAATANAVTVGQAFHWFDGQRALAEIDRVLVKDGRLGLIWNLPDLRQPIQARLDGLFNRHRGDTPSHRSGHWRQAFAATSLFVLAGEYRARHHQYLDVNGLVDRVASMSFIAALPDPDRDEFLGEVRALAPACGGHGRLDYETEVLIYERVL